MRKLKIDEVVARGRGRSHGGAQLMSRRASDIPARDRVIVALDVPDLAGLETLLDRLDGRPAFYKVGLELFVGEGERAIELGARARRARVPGPQAARHPGDGGARGRVARRASRRSC